MVGSSELSYQARDFSNISSERVFMAIGIMHVDMHNIGNNYCVYLNCGKPTLF